MRIRFGELSEAETNQRKRICALAGEAWSRLGSGSVEGAREAMAQIDPRLSVHATAGQAQGARCVELLALETSAWPLAELVLQQAPPELGYALSLGRGAVPLAGALQEVRASHALDLSRATVRAGFTRGHLLEVTLGVPGGNAGESQQNAAENLVRALLGDRLFETWIGAVHVSVAPRGGPLRMLDAGAPRSELYVHELFDTVAAAVRGVLRGLPEQCSGSVSEASGDAGSAASSEGWTLLEVEPLTQSLGQRKDDLLLSSTCTPELLRCYLDGSPCSSRRFSRSGERFVFVSYVDEQTTVERRVARRTTIESALAEALAGQGFVTGVGLGVHATYLDFALCNLETGLGRLVSKLKELGAPERSFIQFYDSELSEEWLSIWPNSRLPAS